MSNQGQQVVITGSGWVTPFASGTVADVLLTIGIQVASKDVGPRSVPPPVEAAYLAIPEASIDAFPSMSKEIRQDKGAWVTAVAVEHAFRESGLDRASLAAERLGMVLGCALAGQTGMIQFSGEVRQQSARFVSPINFPQTVGNFIAGAIARAYNVRGPNTTLAAGSASSLDALCEASAILQSGLADVMLAGGTDVFTETLAAAMVSFPTSVEGRDSNLAEGACWFVLERAGDAAKRGARPLATIKSWTHGCHASRNKAGVAPASARLTPASAGVAPCVPMVPVSSSVAPASSRWEKNVNDSTANPSTGKPKGDPPESSIISTAGLRRPGAICIQDRIGFCPGAAGASALAAALGAASGLPIDDSASAKSKTTFASPGGTTIPARILAGDEGSHLTSLDVDLPPNA